MRPPDNQKWEDVPEAGSDFQPLPDGKYVCMLKSGEELSTTKGNPMWKLTWEVVEGEYTRRQIYDNLVWFGAGMSRVKILLSRIGVNPTGTDDVMIDDLYNRKVGVAVKGKTYVDKNNQVKEGNEVLFDGYERYQDLPIGVNPVTKDNEFHAF